jgi:serine/threonine-protein kinase HipA
VTTCRICLGDAPATYHRDCAIELFGSTSAPRLDIDLARLHTLALAMAGKTSLSGVQRKISLGLSSDRATLQVAAEGGRYILKPQAPTFPHLPENEHVTMRIAARAGIAIPPCGLVQLADGSPAFLSARFDRAGDRKRRQEDFCQLAEKAPKERYDGSAELCARIVRDYASEPGIDIVDLYRRVVFGWWTGNGDMHLKNLSLLADDDGRFRLSPAYDLLCTRLAIPDDRLALPVGGKDDHLTLATWRDYAGYCKLPERAAARVLREIVAAVDDAASLVERSFLPDDAKQTYADLLRERAAVLAS